MSAQRRLRRVLITGAQGFVGRFCAAHWLRLRPEAQLLGLGRSAALPGFTHRVCWGERDLPAPLPRALVPLLASPRYRYLTQDLLDRPGLEAVLASFHPDAVVHLASALRGADPVALETSTTRATGSLLEAVAAACPQQPLVLLGSSGGVYGVPEVLPIPEQHPCAPTYPYARAKLAAEEVAREVAGRHGLPLVVARIFNPVGPGQDERHLAGRIGGQLAAIARGLAPPELSLMPLDATRDFQDVRDVAAALVRIAERGEPGSTLNVASGAKTPTSRVWEILLAAARARGAPPVSVTWLPARPGDVPRHQGDVARLRSLGHIDHHPLEESLEALLDWYLGEVAAVAEEHP
ncbi:MAG: NAD-dependent epimerase/dehydratase family protein [Pseudomonadota bacterium]